MKEIPTLDNMGKIAYDAYCKHRNWKTFKGEPLPHWEDVKESIKEGWRLSAKAVINSWGEFEIGRTW